MSANLERQIWNLLEAGGMTRELLERHLPRCSSEAIRIKLRAMEGRRLIAVNTEGTFFRLQDAYKPAFIAVARSSGTVPPREPIRTTTYLPEKDGLAITIHTEHTEHTSPVATKNSKPPEPDDRGEETPMPAKTKTCGKCKLSKPLAMFDRANHSPDLHTVDCKACRSGKKPAAAKTETKSPRQAARKAAPKARRARATRAPAAQGNGALIIPAGREVRGNVLHQGNGVLVAELVAAMPGRDPDQRIELNRDQVLRIHAWFGQLLAE